MSPGFKKQALIFLFLSCVFTAAAQKYNFRHYDIEDGLVQSQVQKIYQDPDHYMWFGTLGGMSRFDGKEFLSFTKSDGLSTSMIPAIMKDRHGRVWVGEEGGLSVLEGSRITNVKTPGQRLVRTIVEDSGGRIWFTRNSMLFTKRGKDFIASPITGKGEYVSGLVKNKQGELYASVYAKGIFKYDGKRWTKKAVLTDSVAVSKIVFDRKISGKMYLLTNKMILEVSGNAVRPYANAFLATIHEPFYALEQDASGYLWIGTNNGAYWLRAKDPVHFNAGNGFTGNLVIDIFSDAEDNIWLAADGTGVFKFEGDSFETYNKFNGAERMIMAIGKDGDGSVWLGTTGNGLTRYENGAFKTIPVPSPDRSANTILCIYNDRNERMLVGTSGGLWSYKQKKFTNLFSGLKYPVSVRSVLRDRNGILWMASPGGCSYMENGTLKWVDGLENSNNMILEAGNDSILVANNRGLALVKGKKLDAGFRIKALDHVTVFGIYKSGNILLASTFGDGLFMIDLHTRAFKRFGTKDGFFSNDIYSITKDGSGFFWAGTGRGVNKFAIDGAKHTLKVITDPAQKVLIETNQNAILYDQGKVWVAATKGLFIFNARSPGEKHKKPFIVIQSLKVTEQSQAPANKGSQLEFAEKIPVSLQLNHRQNRVVIVFRGIHFSDPDDVSYQYRLKGLGETFSQPVKGNMIEYPSLSPGSYRFEVRAVTSSGTRSEIAAIDFTITPPFYQTIIFRIFMLLLLIGLVIGGQYAWNYRKEKQKKIFREMKKSEQQKIRQQTAEDFHDDIGNKLTRITVLSEILTKQIGEQNTSQKDLIEQIKGNAATLYSGTKDILWALDPQSDNLYEIIKYVTEFGKDHFSNTGIGFRFEKVDPACQKIKLPMEYSRNITMIVKEVFSNILKHSGAKIASISIASGKDGIGITISDDGSGFDPGKPAGGGRGLNNIRVRAKRINSRVDLQTAPGRGTSVHLFIPPVTG